MPDISIKTIRGEIDNRVKGIITGKIWLVGRSEPLELQIQGNCQRDIAGCLVTFENPGPAEDDDIELATMQSGCAGYITASRKIQYLEDKVNKTCNSLFMEWYSDVNGLIVLEAFDYVVVVSEPKWFMTDEEEVRLNTEINARAEAWEQLMHDEEDGEYRPMNEFEWEQNLKETDYLVDRFSNVLEKYLDHPDAERMIAREMGWEWLEASEDGNQAEIEPVEAAQESVPVPDPLAEGIDWIRGASGRVTHPLTDRSYKIALGMWQYFKSRKKEDKSYNDPDVRDMIFKMQTITAKLAGALDHIAFDSDVESGFVVACLKRTLPIINQLMASMDNVENKKIMPAREVSGFKIKVLEIRDDVLSLMVKYRKIAD